MPWLEQDRSALRPRTLTCPGIRKDARQRRTACPGVVRRLLGTWWPDHGVIKPRRATPSFRFRRCVATHAGFGAARASAD